ncbi:MAG: N-methyl-L-tryptophan oxidase [Rubrobacteraceae bacterium]
MQRRDNPLFDVIVAGLGGMGSAAAYHLARRGKHVLGLERFGPAHDKGSSHGGSRIIRQAYFENPSYVPLVLRAYELWEDLERETSQDLMAITGGLMLGPEGSRTVTGSIESAEQWGLEHEVLDAKEIKNRFPVFEPSEGVTALYEARTGFVRPERSVAAHLGAAEARGAELHFEEPVVSWEADASGEGVRVTTESGVYEAGRLVISPGAWAPELLSGLNLPLEAQRLVQFWFMPKGGVEPFKVGRVPIWIWEAEDGVQFYGFPAHDAPEDGVKVAFFRVGPVCTPETIDRTVREEEVEHIRSYLRDHVPALDGEFLRAKTCMYTNTPDENFVISAHPEHPQVAIACGFSGHGYKFCGVVGEMLADLTTEGETRHPISLFSPERLR